MAMAVMEFEEVAVLIVIDITRGGHDMERCAHPHVRRLVPLLIDERRIPHPFVIHTKPLAQGHLGLVLVVGGIRCWTSVAVLPLTRGGERLRGRLEVASML